MPVSQRPRRKRPAKGPWPKPAWREALMEYVIIAWGLAMIVVFVLAKWL